jgi:hypothetical protein
MNTKEDSRGHGVGKSIVHYTVIGALLGLALGGTIWLVVPVTQTPSVELQIIPDMEGTEGYEIVTMENELGSRLTLLIMTPFELGPRVKYHSGASQPAFGNFPYFSSWFNHQQQAEGLFVELENTAIEYKIQTHIAYQAIENITCRFEITALSRNVEFEVDFAWNSKRVELDVGEKRVFEVQAPIDKWRSNTDDKHWLKIRDASVTFHFHAYAAMRIDSISIVADRVVPMSEVHLSLQDFEGHSLYDSYRELLPDWFSGIRLVEEGNNSTGGTLSPSSLQEVLYVPAGNYTGTVGVFDYSLRDGHLQYQIPLSLHANSRVYLTCRIDVVRIELDFTPRIPFEHIGVYLPDSEFGLNNVHLYDVSFETLTYIYIPHSDERVSISMGYDLGFGSQDYFHTDIDLESASVIRLTVDPNVFLLGGVILSPGMLIVACILLGIVVGAVAAQLRGSTPMDRERFLRNPLLVPIGLLAVSLFVPWLRYRWTLGIAPYAVEEYFFMTPLGVILKSMGTSALQVTPNTGELPMVILLFWFPFLSLIGRAIKGDDNESKRPVLGYLLSPLLAWLVGYVFGFGTRSASYGTVFVVAAPLSWVMIRLLVNIRKK